MSNLPRGEQQPSDRFFGSYGLLKSSDLNRSVSPGLQDWFRAFGLDEEGEKSELEVESVR